MDLREKIDFLLEKKGDTYEFAAVMLGFNFPQLKQIQKLIDKEDIYEEKGDRSYGLENEPHCTLLYGIHEGVSKQIIESLVSDFEIEECEISTPSLFENEKYDVLKYKVKEENLKKINKLLSGLPNSNEFPTYKPHLTIGYLKSGTGKKYVKLLRENKLYKFNLKPNYIIYSNTDGKQNKIKL